MNLVWNPAERRFRSGIRLAVQSMLFLLLAFGVVFVLGDIILPLIPESASVLQMEVRENFLLAEMVSPLIPLIAALLSVWLAGRYLDRREFRDFGFHWNKRWFKDFGFGLCLGALLMTFIFLTELALGWVKVTGFFQSQSTGLPFLIGFIVDIIAYLSIGIYEELLFRGYYLRNLAEGLNMMWIGSKKALVIAFILTSILFGFLHGNNPGATWISTVNIILAGMFLAFGYILTGELAIPIGLHISWNFVQGAIFGFPVSGLQSAASLVRIEQAGPVLFTGGFFGPEAGLLGILSMLMGVMLIYLYINRMNKSISLKTALAEYAIHAGSETVAERDIS